MYNVDITSIICISPYPHMILTMHYSIVLVRYNTIFHSLYWGIDADTYVILDPALCMLLTKPRNYQIHSYASHRVYAIYIVYVVLLKNET